MHQARPPDRGSRPTSEYTASHSISTATSPHCFVPCSTKTVSQNQPLETAASKPVESPKSVSGDWLPTPEIARNRANSRVIPTVELRHDVLTIPSAAMQRGQDGIYAWVLMPGDVVQQGI